jgi:hypothetical protein
MVYQSMLFFLQNGLKLTYEHLWLKNVFRLAIARHKGKGTREVTRERDGSGVGEGREGMEG